MKSNGKMLHEWVKGFEKELQERFNPDIRVQIRIHKETSPAEDEKFIEGMAEIAKIVSEVSGIEYYRLFNKTRGTYEESDGRMIAMALMFKYITKSKSTICRFFGRDHTSTIHAIKTVNDRLETNDQFTVNLYSKVENRLFKKGLTNENRLQNITNTADSAA